MSASFLELGILAKRNEAAGVVSLALARRDGAALPGWEPGAHIDLILPNGLVRQYSLCGDPNCTDHWRVAILDDPHSRGGSRLIHQSVSAGDTLKASAPRNHFAIVEASSYLFIAGGIGITPLLPMIGRVAARGKPWSLLYGGRSRAHMAFLDELTALPGENISLFPEDEVGRIDLASVELVDALDTAVYCCGPDGLITAVEQRCGLKRGVRFYRERFAAMPKADLEPGAFEVELARQNRRVTVGPYESLLRVLHREGCAVQHSCDAGICGTCLLPVLGGIPDHRDDILTPEECQSGKVILPCVSRSKTPLLIVDL